MVNESWTCIPPFGITCTPASGSGDIQTEISAMEPGQQVSFTRSAELANAGIDQAFQYILIATESSLNLDLNAGNNDLELDLETGLFADGFE